MTGPLEGELLEAVDEAIEAVGNELGALMEDPATTIDIRNGSLKGSVGPFRIWAFEFDGHIPVQPEAPAAVKIRGQDPVEATLMDVGDFELLLGVREEFGESVPAAKLSFEPWFIFRELRLRLEEFSETDVDPTLARALLDFDAHEPSASDPLSTLALPGLGSDQRDAVAASLQPDLRFIWGPPGTGKTLALAAAVRARVENDESVLVVATSNAAVDVAMVRVAGQLEGNEHLENGRVLRLGIPQLEEAQACHDILPDEIIRRRQPALVERRDDLHGERRRLGDLINAVDSKAEQQELAKKLDAVRAELSELERRIKEAQVELLLNAKVVGSTLARLVIDETLWGWPRNAVFVDEASMAGMPYLLAIALSRPQNLSCFGDFRQLPPIAQSRSNVAKKWFARDVFETAGVVSRIENNDRDPRLSTLRLQYRMGEQIADTVGDLAYFGMLRTDPPAEEAASRIATVPPAGGQQVVLVDTSDLSGACLKEPNPLSWSRFNAVAAAVAATVAQELVGAGIEGVGLVSPYRAQSRVLQSMVRGEPRLMAATVHMFQGSERDGMVIDLTDSWPQERPSALTGRIPDTSLRLLNVAMSRAKGKLVICVDLDFVRRTHPTTSPVRRLVEDIVADEGVVPLTDLIGGGLASPPIVWSGDWEDAVAKVNTVDLGSSTQIDIGIPSEGFVGPRLHELVERQTELGRPVRLRAPMAAAAEFEQYDDLDIKLLDLGSGAVLFAENELTVVAGRNPDAPVAVVEGAAPSFALRRLLLPMETT